MTTHAEPRSYTIRETAALTGLPASTLRYYEQVGVIPPISRGASSGHRVYGEDDLDQLTAVSCLAATGMGLDDMRHYMANATRGAAAAAEQRELLEQQQRHLTVEAERLVLRQRYVDLKIAYWQAVEDGDATRSEDIASRARELAEELRAVTDH
ncbi:MerR family transcriptional regulator [Nocardioides ganghwensis]|uniref:MerR family transcriptional regulator n=1 Tax=Nocardioides ganghwensis TaxID=252230 RepID=A0A4Q2SFR8_9ACTN|nr:MerR family transcriptional regulator [Nocardioides ganghwensis]MBD3944526.1 MerR family transcriptional regulator [Nocardioides ganghwensis]RYC04285.1 MerR family transcriptional regulator [Nocardioides ganghwensis]